MATSASSPVPAMKTSFDTTAARELMGAWKAFDTAEQQAMTTHQAALGEYVDTMLIPPADHARQVAGREHRLIQTPEWIREQQRRDRPARAQRTRTMERAHESLRQATLTTVIAFLDRQVQSGRLPRGDRNALLNTLQAAGIPPVRFRKWSGPQPVEFAPIEFGSVAQRYGVEYRDLMQDVRRVWVAAARGHDVATTDGETIPGSRR